MGDSALMSRELLVRNDVRRLVHGDYARALELFVAALRRQRGVVAIYQMGSIRFPGISDIDLIIVVDRAITAGTDFRDVMRAATGPDGPYIFSHAPYVISAEEFPRLPQLFFADNLRHCWGQTLAFAPLPATQQEFYAYHTAVEAAVAQSFVFLRALHGRALPNLRSLLCHLNAVRHNFSTIARWVDCAGRRHWTDYVARIDRLRSAWFDLDDGSRLDEAWALTNAARDILLEILDELTRIGLDRNYIRPGNRQAWLSLLDVNILLDFSPGATARFGCLANPAGFMRRLPLLGPTLTLRPRVREFFGAVSVVTLPSAVYPLVDGWSDRAERLAGVMRRRRLGVGESGHHDLPEEVRGWMASKGECLDRYLSFVHAARLSGLLLLTPATWLQVSASLPNRIRTRWNEAWVRRRLATP